MTATTNGASLEDCLTNIFSLIDLNGIRWKRFKAKENSSYLYTPIYTHPILTTYAKCIEENHIAVWRHEPQKRHTAGGGAGHSSGQPGSTGHSNFPTPTRASNNNTPTSAGPSNNGNQGNNNTSNSGQTNYELWIFGYGNQLRVDNVIGDDLVEIEDDTWESKGLSYECRTLLFKALHNLVERCLIGKGFTRIGRWFVQPLAETTLDAHYSSSSSFASSSLKNKHLKLDQSSINSALISSLNRIIESDGLRHTSTRSSNTYFTSSLDGSKSSLSFAFSFFVHGDSTICATVDVRQHPLVHPLTMADLTTYQEGGIVRVALAPYGLNGILNGVSYKDSDNGSATTTFTQQWSKFYPLPKTMARLVIDKQSTNSAMTNFNQKIPSNASNQFNQSIDGQSINGSRSYLSNLTNMLLPPSSQKSTIHFNHEPNEVPPVVEVIVSGYRMRYPAECVFTTSKVVDIYKSLSVSSNSKSATASNKRPNRSSSNKSHKISILNEKLSEEKTNSQVKIKTESDISATAQSDFNSPFKVSSTETSMTKPDRTAKQSVGSDMTKDKTVNGYAELEGNNPALMNNQTTLSRFNSTKVGFGSNNTPLGPTDLVKLFPTPPSLEQIILSPSNQNEEASAKDVTTLSPANMNQTADITRDNGIDVYKPVECALMPPPPKWAALANIVISSSKSLPPECVYKGSPQNSKSIISRFTESIKSSLPKCSTTKQIASLIHKNSIHSPAPSPLTDQTNKNGPNSLNLNSSPQKTPVISSLTTTSTSNSSLPTTDSSVTPILSSFTLPHQRLFNNLNEVNSIQLNLMISDSTLGMFKDHNFESCTICVCNMSIKGIHLDAIPHKIEQNVQWKSTIGNDNIVNCPPFPGEFINECTCGFSAINNRHSSHLSGLFLEDELELTNVLYDPTEMIDQNKLYRKIRLSSYSESSYAEEEKLVAQKLEKISSQSSHSFEETKIFVIDQLKQQCTSIIHSNSSLSKVILIESFRNNRHLTSCTNYYAQTTNKSSSNGPFYRFLDDSNKHITVKMMNRNPLSLKFSDFCELTKGIITKLGGQSQAQSRFSGCLVKPLGTNSGASSGLSSIFSRMFSPNRQSLFGKSNDSHSNARNNIFIQGLQALVMPTLSIDPKEALQMLEYLIKDESKEALATLNKAILIFTSPIHDWQFLTAPVPENNFDVANLLKIIQPLLDESIGTHNKLYKDFVHQQQQHIFSARDSPTGAPVLPTPPCQGPLTWRQFHQSAGRGTEDQCEPQPIPSLLVGHAVEKNHLAVSPFALKFWDKLLLEPYASAHNMYYLVLAPDSKNVIGHITTFFKELSNTYELMKLGKHQPIGNGIIKSASNSEIQTDEDDWFSKLSYGEKDPANAIASKLRSYASKLNATLAKTIVDFLDERQPAHDPHADRFDSSPSPHGNKPLGQVSVKTSLPQTSNRAQNHILGMGSSNCQLLENFGGYGSENQSQLESQAKSQTLISSSSHAQEDNIHLEDESSKQTGIVIYIVDPFSSPSITQNLRALATFGLLKCYSILLAHLPEHVKRVTQLQLISLDSIISHSRSILNISMVDQLKSLSMNVYSRCRKILTNQITAKSLTGFGPAAALESFFKTKNAELCLTKMFTPPFILAPMKDKQTELGEMFGDRREKSSVLFCSYCITEDQRWLLASITNDKGEMSESTVININIVDRLKKPKSTVKRVALRKLMEFIISVMSDWMNPWRLIIGKLGRVGHGELKEWATLMSKRSLLNYSRHLTERCRQCSILPSTETVSVLSACLVSMEPDSRLRIMPDQFTSDDRQASFNKCPLSTPEDASATHILVFPTSASIQSAHGNVEDPLNGSGLDDDLLNQFPLEDGIEDLGVEENMDDLFSAWDDTAGNVADNISSHHDTMMSSSNLQLGTGSVGDGANSQDETLQLLQQPLALGYYISTAKIGHMPNWFWSTSPHLRNSCPVFLKSALHIHMPCVQLSDDLLHSGVGQSRKSHQLDSNLTTDVLRYVLEGYNSLSWLALNPKSYDRQSCLPVHMQNLLQLYHMMESFS